MKITLLAIGKTDNKELDKLIGQYTVRIGHYLPFELKIISDVKRSGKTTEESQKLAEGKEILSELAPTDKLILLDERGKSFSSREFASFLEGKMLQSERRLVFVIGGPYGFSPEVYTRANEQLSLSKMTFSHQMVRLFITEQIYRAMTILRGEPYHHD